MFLGLGRRAYLVGLVVVLRVVLEDLFALGVLEGVDEVVNAATELFPPLLAVKEPWNGCQGARRWMTGGVVLTSAWRGRR